MQRSSLNKSNSFRSPSRTPSDSSQLSTSTETTVDSFEEKDGKEDTEQNTPPRRGELHRSSSLKLLRQSSSESFHGSFKAESWVDFHDKYHSQTYHYSCSNEKILRKSNGMKLPSGMVDSLSQGVGGRRRPSRRRSMGAGPILDDNISLLSLEGNDSSHGSYDFGPLSRNSSGRGRMMRRRSIGNIKFDSIVVD